MWIIDKINDAKKARIQRQLMIEQAVRNMIQEKERQEKERLLAIEKKKEEERKVKEKKNIVERERLMSMEDKELLAEVILTLKALQKEQEKTNELLEKIERRISSISSFDLSEIQDDVKFLRNKSEYGW